MKKLILFALALISHFSVKAELEMKDLEFHALENFSVDRRDGNIYIGFDYVITNPNWYGIIIKPSSLYLRIAETDCGWVTIDEKMKLKRKTKAGYHFTLKGNATNFVKSSFSSVWNLITGKGIAFHIKGTLKAGVSFFKIKLPVDYTYTMTNEEFMSFF